VSPPKDKVGNTEKVLEIFVSKSWSDPGTVIDPVTGDGDKLSNVTRQHRVLRVFMSRPQR